MSERIVVLGGGYAGVLAAARIGRRAPVTLVNASADFVDRIRLHQRAATGRVATVPLARMVKGSRVELVIGRAGAWRPERRTLVVDGRTLEYDRLIYALGSATDVDRVPGVRRHALTLDAGGADELARRVPSLSAGAQVLVAGGGPTALETASELAEAHPRLRITLVTAGRAGEALSQVGREHLRRALARLGVTLVENVPIDEVRERELVAGSTKIGFDLCVWAGGFRAAPLAAEAGLPVNERGQLLVDGCLRSLGDERIFGAGDAATPVDAVGAPVRMGCKSALPLAAQAADNVLALLDGKPLEPLRFADLISCVSLGRKDGLVDRHHPDGSVRERALTGRFAALVKELICRFAAGSPGWQARGLLRYRWPKMTPILDGDTRRRLAA